MEKQILSIKRIDQVTHNVLRFTLENSENIQFVPGQAAEVAIDKDGWRDKAHPFTFTSLPDDNHLEFTIKIYPEHEGVTNELSKLRVGDHLIINSIFGAIKYKGMGTFIAGGAGVTPFISIIRDLNRKSDLRGNRLLFANSKSNDIINKEEFEFILGDHFQNILSQEEMKPYAHGYMDIEYLKDNIVPLEGYFYVCGPPPMMKAVIKSLKELGINDDKIIKEKF